MNMNNNIAKLLEVKEKLIRVYKTCEKHVQFIPLSEALVQKSEISADELSLLQTLSNTLGEASSTKEYISSIGMFAEAEKSKFTNQQEIALCDDVQQYCREIRDLCECFHNANENILVVLRNDKVNELGNLTNVFTIIDGIYYAPHSLKGYANLLLMEKYIVDFEVVNDKIGVKIIRRLNHCDAYTFTSMAKALELKWEIAQKILKSRE